MKRDGEEIAPGQIQAAKVGEGQILRCEADRRAFVRATVVAGIVGALPRIARAAEARGRPQKGDHFAFFSGERAGAEIKPEDLAVNGPQVVAWPVDPQTGSPREDSRLNQVILIRLDPESLDEPTRAHAADGIVGYSAICTHAQCPIAGWNAQKKVFHCNCHNSEYDPRHGAKVVFGPAPRPLAALPLAIEDGALVASGTFIGRVGTRPA
jgi:rieske iron-sulfur protein